MEEFGELLLLLIPLGGYSAPSWALLAASAFVLVSLSLSFYLLFEHLSAYKNPEEQKFLIGVILMVPCYAIESVISLAKPSISVDIEILRDCYESFAMYCFGRYLVACLGGEERAVEFMEREGRTSSKSPLLGGKGKGIVEHPFPMKYFLKPWRLGQWFYQVIKIGIVQYVCTWLNFTTLSSCCINGTFFLECFVSEVQITDSFPSSMPFYFIISSFQMIIKVLTSILAVVLEAFGVYCEGEFKWGCGYPYVAVVLNFSQSWALYCLVQFYTVTKDELAHIKPLYKFLTFKSIVFLTWWQGVAIALLCSFGLFNSPIAQGLQFQSSVQAFIICIEMGIASVVHLFVFPAKPYELMGDQFSGTVSVLGDYVSVDCPVDPDEVRDSQRPTKLRLPQPDTDIKSGMTITESVRDVVIGGSEYIVKDVKFTMNQAVEPVEKGISKFNEKLHKISHRRRTKDDSSVTTSSPARRVIRGIDDPLLNGSISDSGVTRGKKHRRRSGYASGESGGESSNDQSYGGYLIRGQRWITKE